MEPRQVIFRRRHKQKCPPASGGTVTWQSQMARGAGSTPNPFNTPHLSSRTKAHSAEDAGSIPQQLEIQKWIPDRATLVRDDIVDQNQHNPAYPRAGGNPTPNSQAGFSLMEVMVTLVIVGLASAIAVATLPPTTPSLAREADRLATRLANASDLALIENRAVLFDITDQGYAQRIRSFAGWATPQNTPAQSPWETGTTITHPTGRLPAAIMFDSIGLTEPTTLTLIRDGRTETIAIDGAGNVTRGGAAS